MKFSDSWEDKSLLEWIAIVVVVILIIAAFFGFVMLEVWLLWLLWNGCIVAVFALPQVTYWQMFGIYLVAKWLFGSVVYTTKKDD